MSLYKFLREVVGTKRTMPAWAILLALVVFVIVTSPFFLKSGNIGNVLRQSVALGIVSIGQTYVILIAGIDLSVGATISLVSVLSTGMMGGRTEMIVPAVVSALVLGLVIGLINGLIVTRLKVPDFLVTLGMMFIIGGTALAYTPKPAGLVAAPFALVARASWGPLPVCVIGFAFLVAVAVLVLNKTTLGRYIYAVGGDAESRHGHREEDRHVPDEGLDLRGEGGRRTQDHHPDRQHRGDAPGIAQAVHTAPAQDVGLARSGIILGVDAGPVGAV